MIKTIKMGTVDINLESRNPSEAVCSSTDEISKLFQGLLISVDNNYRTSFIIDYLSTLTPEQSGKFIMSFALRGLDNSISEYKEYLDRINGGNNANG